MKPILKNPKIIDRPPVPASWNLGASANIHTSNNHGLMALFARIYSKCTNARRSLWLYIYTHTYIYTGI